MPYLIDGHNLIPKIPGLSLKKVDDEIALIELLQQFSQRTGKKLEVFFDNAPQGYSGKRQYGNVTAHFVRTGTTADHAIRARLFQLKGAARNWMVVSSDRQVQAEARGVRAQVIPSETFASDLLKIIPPKNDIAKQNAHLSQSEIEEWLSLFRTSHDTDSSP